MTPSKLLSIAPELIQAVSDELDINTLKALTLTCKQLGDTLAPRVLHSISLNVNQHTLEKEMPKIRALAGGKTAASQGTKVLMIRGLSPTFDPSYRCTWSYKDGEVVRNGPPPVVSPEAQEAEVELKACLRASLVSLKSIQKVTWCPIREDEEWSQDIVIEALKSFTSLQTLDLDLKECKISLRLHDITTLHAISLTNIDYSRHAEEIYDNFAKMVSKSPNLTSVDILPVKNFSKPTPPTHSLHQVFKYYPADAPPLRLRHIGLNACLLRLDHTTLRHLKTLKSLQLTAIIDPYAPPYDGYETNIDNGEEQKRVGSSLADIWKTMEAQGIWLEAIHHEDVCPEFLDYLSSYSGLKSLNVRPDPWHKGLPYSNPLATRFFANPGPLFNHLQTLENLHIEPRYEGDWCFDSHNASAVAACINLRTFGMSVLSSRVRYSDDAEPLANGDNPDRKNAVVSHSCFTSRTRDELISFRNVSLTQPFYICHDWRLSKSTART